MTRRRFHLEWSGGGARMRCAPAAYNMLYMLYMLREEGIQR